MSILNRIHQADAWLLDTVFQPIADRLPERLPAVELGLSFQLGAILFYGASIGLMMVVGHMSFGDSVFNVLVWCVGLAFFVGISRVRSLVRPGQPNPLRPMLAGMRPLSIPFMIIAAVQGANAPPPLMMSSWFMTLSDVVFVLGLYLISCQPRPPSRQATREKRVKLTALEGGLGRG
ncbi:hypothetical protein [Acidomonas methanolica]|uniref:hypothetical protein n=1 Tax=Acidomonas methanolica TaxID=437 RepID=UPI00211A794B|nr:hypothetical protein [Acidomonas methanolica]MCQ9155450.1 hypothetical protein [Acidomonas methanolica]